MKKIIPLLLLVGLFAAPAQANDNAFGVAWSIAIPTGNTNDYVPGISLRGMNLEFRNFIQRDVAWGLNIGWNAFNKQQDNTLYEDNYAVTGLRWHYVNTVPIYASAYKYWGAKRDTRYFAGANVGTAWLERKTTLGLFEDTDKNWHFAFAPEFGVNMPWSSFIGYISVRYNVLLAAGDVESQGWFEFRIGIGLD